MVDIPIYNRSQLPPDRAGMAKMPYELADRSGQRELGAAIEKTGGDVADSLIKAKAANEVYQFYGVRDGELATFGNYLEQNPNASIEELKAEGQKVIARINTAGQNLKTGLAKDEVGNWFLANKDVLNERIEGSIYAVQSRQAVDIAEVTIERLIAEGKDKELIAFMNRQSGKILPVRDLDEADFKNWYKERAENTGINPNPDDPNHKYDYRAAYMAESEPQIQEDGKYHWPSQFKADDHPNRFVNGADTKAATGTPLIHPVVAEAKLKAGLAKIKANKQKAQLEMAKITLENDLRNSVLMFDENGSPVIDPKTGRQKYDWTKASDLINDPSIQEKYNVSIEDADKILEDLKSQAAYKEAKETEALENQKTADSQLILDKILKSDFENINSFINSTSLNPDEKESWIKKAEDRAKAINDGKNDPFVKGDNKIESLIATGIDAGDETVTTDKINSLRGSGLSNDAADRMLTKLKNADTPQNKWRNAITSIGTSYLKDLEQSEIFGDKDTVESAEKLATKHLQWQAWRSEHPDATQEESMAYLKDITRKERLDSLRTWYSTDNWDEAKFTKEAKNTKTILGNLSKREQSQTTKRRYIQPVSDDTKKSDSFTVGQQIIKNGVTYTYKGDGKWEY